MNSSPPNWDRDLDDEIRHHISECTDLLVSQGWDEALAREEAERRFGERELIRDELVAVGQEGAFRMKLLDWFRLWATDTRYAIRRL